MVLVPPSRGLSLSLESSGRHNALPSTLFRLWAGRLMGTWGRHCGFLSFPLRPPMPTLRAVVFYAKPLNVFFMIIYIFIESLLSILNHSHLYIPIISCQKIARALMFTNLLKSTINKSLFLFFSYSYVIKEIILSGISI